AALARRTGDVPQAEKLARVAFEMQDDYDPARALLASLEDSLAATGPDPERFFYQGRLRIQDGKYEMAVALLSRATALDSTAIDYQKYLGIAQFKREVYDEALSLFQNVLRKDPDDPDAHFYMGSLFFELHHFDIAVRELLPVANEHR